MYPEMIDKEHFGYVYSSRYCYRRSKYYINYINSFKKKKKYLLLIDGQGSGRSFLHFIKKTQSKNIIIYFFVKYNSKDVLKIKENKNLCLGFYHDEDIKKSNIIDINLLKCTNLKKRFSNIIFFNKFSHSLYIELLLLAPHNRVTYINNKLEPIFNSNRFTNDFGADLIKYENPQILLKLYYYFLKYINYNSNIVYRTLNSSDLIELKLKKYNGILALDIDGTIENIKSYVCVQNLISKSVKNNIKVILVTSRQIPFMYGPKEKQSISTIDSILDKINYNYKDNTIDVWYNPLCFINNNSSQVKYQQLIKTINEYSLTNDSAIFYDDTFHHVKYCNRMGIKSILVKTGTGIDEQCLKHFDTFLNNL